MKILILNGSPKRDKSDTMHMTRAFVNGMNEMTQNEVTVIDVIDKQIEYCTGCFTCMRNGGTCIHKDDMEEILKQILDSDVLLFSFPLYGYGMPAPLKALMDRTLPLGNMAMQKSGERYEHIPQADFSRLRYVMICGCGFPSAVNNFEGMIRQFTLMFPERSTVITVPESPMFNAPEAEPVTKPFLDLIRCAGREYAEEGRISDDTMEKLHIPMIPEDVYTQICNGGNQNR